MLETAVILAAGRGSRLKELTVNRSKAMVPIAGQPMIARVIDSLHEIGIRRFFVVVAEKDSALKEWCSSIPGIEVREQHEPKGSGDALLTCVEDVRGSFLVSACDTLMSREDLMGLVCLFEKQRARVALSVLTVPAHVSLESRSVVRLEGDAVLEFIEKPSSSERISNITSLPVWILSGDVWPHLQGLQPSPRGEYELPAVFNALIAGGKTVVAYRVSGRQDLTNANDFLELNRHYLRNQQPSVQIHSSVQVPASAKLVPPILIGENCRLGEDVTIGPEVYLEGNVGVKAGVELRNCVATRGAEIAESLSTGIKM